MLKKIVGGALLGLLGTSSALLGQVHAQENKENETIKTQQLAMTRAQKITENFANATYWPLTSPKDIALGSLIVFSNQSNYIGGTDVTAFINVTGNSTVTQWINSGSKIYFVNKAVSGFNVGGQDGVYYYVLPTRYTSVSEITGDSTAPTIDGEVNFIVNVDNMLSKEEILSHISAYDAVDGTVSVNWESCEYSPSKRQVGVYNAVVSATDSSGNKATQQIKINVVDITKPVININMGSGDTYEISYNQEFDESDFLGRVFSVTDNYDSNCNLVVTGNTYTGHEGEVGRYTVNVKATDLSGNYSTGSYYFEVVDKVLPVIEGPTSIDATTSHMLTEEEILAKFTANDEYDGELTCSIENYGDYASNWDSKVATRTINIIATDSSGNKATKAVNINVTDTTKPTYSGGTLEYEVSYDDLKMSLDDLKNRISFTDNWDETVTVNVRSDNYSENYNRLGTYQVTVDATDSAGNVSDKVTINIKVVDKKAPIITAPGKIEVGNNTELTLEQLKEKITINDGYDGTITDYTIEGFENYLTNKNKVGEYEITLKVSDSSGNQASTKLTIQVVDKEEPYFVFDDFFIILNEGEELTKEQIIEYATKVLGIEKEEILSVEGEYDTATPGNYKVKLMTMAGEEYTFNISVNKDFEDETLYRELKWYEYIYTWFTILFNINKEYKTDSFWDFSERWGYVVEVYDTGKIRKEGTKQEVETTVVESKDEEDVTKETLNN